MTRVLQLKRLEDGKFLRGDGWYVDDIPLPGTLHVVFVRSMDYCVPRADTMPAELEVSHLETPSPLTVRGMKGMGERVRSLVERR